MRQRLPVGGEAHETGKVRSRDFRVREGSPRLPIELKRLTEISRADLVALMNQPLLRRHLPLLRDSFSEEDGINLVAAKEKLWQEHGYGPWAFVVNGELAGWGGLQPEGGEADLALVLHPRFWGIGPQLCDLIIRIGFEEMHLESIVVLLPSSRTRIRALFRRGFVADGEVEVGGERFVRYRLGKVNRSGGFSGRAPGSFNRRPDAEYE